MRRENGSCAAPVLPPPVPPPAPPTPQIPTEEHATSSWIATALANFACGAIGVVLGLWSSGRARRVRIGSEEDSGAAEMTRMVEVEVDGDGGEDREVDGEELLARA
jgi:hypothetical protein